MIGSDTRRTYVRVLPWRGEPYGVATPTRDPPPDRVCPSLFARVGVSAGVVGLQFRREEGAGKTWLPLPPLSCVCGLQPRKVEGESTPAGPAVGRLDHLGVPPWGPDLMDLVSVALGRSFGLVTSVTTWTWWPL